MLKKAGKQHGIGNVRNKKFIQAQDSAVPGPVRGNAGQRVTHLPLLPEAAVNALHETVKVNPLFLLDRQLLEKQVHQPGFTPAHAAPDIKTLNVLRPVAADSVQQLWLALQSMPQRIQGSYNPGLARIGEIFALAGKLFVVVERRGIAQNRTQGLSGPKWIPGR